MNKERIKAAFRQVQEDCKLRQGVCRPTDLALCKHNELCDCLTDGSPKTWKLK